MKIQFRNLIIHLKTAASNARRHKVPRLAAALAFYAILSAAPLVVIAISMTGLLLGTDETESQIVDRARDLVGDSGARIVGDIVSASRRPSTNTIAFSISFLFLLFGASRVFVHTQSAMQTIWETTRTGIRNTIQDRLIGIGMAVGVVVALFLGVLRQAVTASITSTVDERWLHLVIVVDALVSFVITALLVAMIYRYLPRADISWRSAWSGAVLATVLFVAGRAAFGFYLSLGFAHTLQGAAGSLIILILWIYYMAQILFFGAEFTRVRMQASGSRGVRSTRS